MPAQATHRDEIVINVLGGVVTGVFTDIPEAKVTVVDWDNYEPSVHNYDWVGEMPQDSLSCMPPELSAALKNTPNLPLSRH